MRVYFDMCSLQRPLDDKSQLRVLMEAHAVLGVLALCELGKITLVASEALLFETNANPHIIRRDFALQTLAKATLFVTTNAPVRVRANAFVEAGIKPLDALHLASAVEGQADFFCTCDDRLLKKAKTLHTTPTRVVSPLEIVAELSP